MSATITEIKLCAKEGCTRRATQYGGIMFDGLCSDCALSMSDEEYNSYSKATEGQAPYTDLDAARAGFWWGNEQDTTPLDPSTVEPQAPEQPTAPLVPPADDDGYQKYYPVAPGHYGGGDQGSEGADADTEPQASIYAIRPPPLGPIWGPGEIPAPPLEGSPPSIEEIPFFMLGGLRIVFSADDGGDDDAA